MQLDDDADILLGDGSEETTPQDLYTGSAVFDMRFHPSAPLLAVGLVSGGIEIHQWRRNETRMVTNMAEVHTGGVTGVEFSEDGQYLLSCSSDKSISVYDCNTQQQVLRVQKAKSNPHKHGISSMNVCTESILATGDDDGLIALWDLRQQKVVAKYHEHGDYVSSMLFFSEIDHLVSSSGDTCLGAFDLRNQKIIDFSDKRPDELNCIAFIPAINAIICGTPSGSLPVWRYGSWSRPYDVFDKHPRECEAIETYNDNIILTGACDSMIRVVQVHPTKRVLTTLGGHSKKYGGGIFRLRISHDRNLVATCGQDNIVRFVDIEFLADESEVDKLRSKAEQRHMATIREANAEDAAAEEQQEGGEEDEESEWSDTSEDDDDEDDGSGDDEEAQEADEEAGEEDSDDDSSDEDTANTTRAKKRARVAAAKWLKEAQKEKVNFSKELKKKRVKGFWGDLV